MVPSVIQTHGFDRFCLTRSYVFLLFNVLVWLETVIFDHIIITRYLIVWYLIAIGAKVNLLNEVFTL